MSFIGYIEIAGIMIFVVFGVFGAGWYKIVNETNKLLKEQNEELKNQNEALKADNKEWIAKHVANEKAIATLQGKIETLTSIPIKEINQSLKELNASNKAAAENTRKTLEVIQKSALIAEEDRDGLFTQNVKDQHVEHQIISKEK
jgi:hypothetical protein